VALIEYVGWIEEILELDYWRFQTIVLLCNWMVANYKGSTTIVKRDEYGFTLMNFERLIPLSTHSFVFPMHSEQGFFFQKMQGHVGIGRLCCIEEPQGRMLKFTREINLELTMFDFRNNVDHPGLRV
jgi:hypothetical protein